LLGLRHRLMSSWCERMYIVAAKRGDAHLSLSLFHTLSAVLLREIPGVVTNPSTHHASVWPSWVVTNVSWVPCRPSKLYVQASQEAEQQESSANERDPPSAASRSVAYILLPIGRNFGYVRDLTRAPRQWISFLSLLRRRHSAIFYCHQGIYWGFCLEIMWKGEVVFKYKRKGLDEQQQSIITLWVASIEERRRIHSGFRVCGLTTL
jgi:hypothetical protein